MPPQSECNLPQSAHSLAACRTHSGPTPRAHLASLRELVGPLVSSVRSSKLCVRNYINDNLCTIHSRHGCNIRHGRVHRCKSMGDTRCVVWCSWWFRSRFFFGRYQRYMPLQHIVIFVLMLSAARSLPIDSKGPIQAAERPCISEGTRNSSLSLGKPAYDNWY